MKVDCPLKERFKCDIGRLTISGAPALQVLRVRENAAVPPPR